MNDLEGRVIPDLCRALANDFVHFLIFGTSTLNRVLTVREADALEVALGRRDWHELACSSRRAPFERVGAPTEPSTPLHRGALSAAGYGANGKGGIE